MSKDIDALKEILSFIESFSNYNIDDQSIEGGMTDAQMLSRNIPVLRNVISMLENGKIEYSYCEIRKAKESVPPLFKFAVVASGLDGECYLTDNFEIAVSKTKLLSLLNKRMFYTLEIYKTHDGTYKTKILFIYNDGKSVGNDIYYREFLHFNYLLEQKGLKMVKI